MAKEKKVSDAQRRAIQVLKKDGPQKAGFWSGWGDMKFGYGAFRLKIATPTGTALIKLGLAELIPADARRADQTLHLTAAGEAVDTSGA